MKIQHTLTFPNEPKIRSSLAGMGVPPDDSIILNFKIYESDPSWPQVAELIKRTPSVVDIVSMEFLKSELQSATHLVMKPSWRHGYPMPDDDFGYLDATYDLSSYCQACGIGGVQNAAFRLKGEPKWGRRSLLQVNWVFDEYFVTPELYSEVFEPFGVGAREVLQYRKLEPLQTVLQLDISSVSPVGLSMDGCSYEVCRDCDRLKYAPLSRGYYPRFYEFQDCGCQSALKIDPPPASNFDPPQGVSFGCFSWF